MSVFSYIRSIYSLDTIDTRFVHDSKTPYKVSSSPDDPVTFNKASDEPPQGVSVKRDGRGQPIAQPSLWKTPEFYFYYFVFIITVPYMFWIAYDVSRPSDPNYHKFEHLLSDGWVPGRKIDVSDMQYHTFRTNIPYLAALLFIHPLFRRAYESFCTSTVDETSTRKNGGTTTYKSGIEAEARLEMRASFDFGFAILFMVALHFFSAIKVFTILYINFCIATRLPRKYVPVATWIFNVGTLFANELAVGYKFEALANIFSSSSNLNEAKAPNWGAWMDSHGGIMPRWEVLFNITVLRLISFNLDYYWSLDRKTIGADEVSTVHKRDLIPAHAHKKKQIDNTNLSERDRISNSADAKHYTFRNYVAYTLYAPLYLAGPIVTFNDYISQLKYRSASIEKGRTIKYAIRFLLVLLSIELLLHFDYCVAISKGNPDWGDYTPAQLSLLSYFNLHVLWLKLLLPWRLFRLWALIDGIDPPENMLRCLSDNPSTIAFWRGWHRSYNKWLIRYIYVPLGGSRLSKGKYAYLKVALNYFLVFTFVALWHDIQLNLLVWGWLIVFFMAPEIIAGMLFPRRKWETNLTAYRCLCAIGAVGNLMMMMIANLVGFAVGVDGLKSIISGIFRDMSGFVFLVTAWSALFVGCQVMFEIREAEMRKGIFLKC